MRLLVRVLMGGRGGGLWSCWYRRVVSGGRPVLVGESGLV